MDLRPFYDLQTDLKVLTEYTNQVAKSVNTTGILRKYETDSMKERLAVISKKITAIHDLLRRK
ncbi:TPA: plasmid mobilization relaxosome protein MobC [Streptococcus suis]